MTVKVAHFRLCHSRMLFVRAYPRESQEMVFDAHERAFTLFKGSCRRGIYDNMKTAVETVFIGKDRLYNRRFLQMCSHYLVEPTACTPASGWEKGQVENQVGLVRERFFTPRLRFKNYDELNGWLTEKCIAYAKAHRHPELPEQTIWEMFEAERGKLVPYPGRFDGFHAVPASVAIFSVRPWTLITSSFASATIADSELHTIDALCIASNTTCKALSPHASGADSIRVFQADEFDDARRVDEEHRPFTRRYHALRRTRHRRHSQVWRWRDRHVGAHVVVGLAKPRAHDVAHAATGGDLPALDDMHEFQIALLDLVNIKFISERALVDAHYQHGAAVQARP